MTMIRPETHCATPRSAMKLRRMAAALVAVGCTLSAGQAWSQSVEDQYREAMYQRETGQPYAAIETLNALLSANPTLNRARLELAVAYYRTLNYAQAREEAQRVLNDPKTPEAVRLSVTSFLKTIELEEKALTDKAHKIEPSVSFGLLHDSNVNAGPDSAILGNGLVLDAASTETSDWGYVAQAAVTHTWLRPAPTRFGQAAVRFGWTSQAALYYKGYNDETDYNLGVLSLSTGPLLFSANNWRANVSFQFDKLTLGDKDLGVYVSATPSFSWRLGTRGELTVDAQWMYRNYQRDVDQGRDANYRQIGLSYGHLFNQGKVEVQGGFKFFREHAYQDRFSNEGHEVFVGGRVRAWAGGDLFARVSIRQSDYAGVEPVFGESRDETENRFEFGASHQFQSGWFEKWLLSATVTHIHNKANLSLYGYDRDLVYVTIGRTF